MMFVNLEKRRICGGENNDSKNGLLSPDWTTAGEELHVTYAQNDTHATRESPQVQILTDAGVISSFGGCM